MKRRFRCIESSFFCDFFDFGGEKLLFCAVHTHVSWSFLLRRGFAPAGATRGLCGRPLDPFAVHSPVTWFLSLQRMMKLPQNKKPRAFPIPGKTRGAFDCNGLCNGLQALETLAAVVEQGGVGAGVFHGNAAAENDAGLRVVGEAAGDVQGGVNRFGQACQSRCAAA